MKRKARGLMAHGSDTVRRMEQLETTSTSSRTAACTPIVLRETDRVRLVFRPVVLVNDAQPRACIRGDFVYERRAASGEWEQANTLSLATVKSGEQYKLELHSAELLQLLETLGPLYRVRWQEEGIASGRRTYVRMERRWRSSSPSARRS
jgi:hypothetical protein